MIRRARLLAVVAILAAGALGVLSSTQTWLQVVLRDAPGQTLEVPGAAAVPVLAPLSLAVLALGGALSIVGLALRYVFGALTVAIAALLAWLTGQVAFLHPTTAVAAVVTDATGITGEAAVADLVARIDTTAWPFVTLFGWLLLLVAGVVTLTTAHTWRGSGRRYRTDAATPTSPAAAGSRPHDAIDAQAGDSRAIDTWDDLSRGEDPTARPLD